MPLETAQPVDTATLLEHWIQLCHDAASTLSTLAERRTQLRFTRGELAAESGYTIGQIRRIETAGVKTTPAEVFVLDTALNRLRKAHR
jgi:hypothetical protein